MILVEAGKFIGKKTAAALIAVAVVLGGVWCWQNPEEVKAFGHVVKVSLIWLAIAAALPWSSYLFMRPLLAFQADRLSTNAAAGMSLAVIAGYWLIDIILAFYLADEPITGTFTWIVVLIGFLAAAAYNFVICESLARHADS
ncbi:MAG: hypothetical protein ABII12_06775 [Planctomycetota bacterium]